MTESPVQTVVVIDDEEEIRALMELALAKPGRTVVGFADGDAALRHLLASVPVDVVVSDVRMAGLDGYALVKQLQERAETAGTPIIFVSANDAVDERLAPAGSDIQFVRKPFDIADLRARVDASIARRATPAPGFRELLTRALERASAAGEAIAVVFAATAPERHSPGVAASVAGIVRACLRRSDSAAAFPPYACAALLAGCPLERAREIGFAVASALAGARASLDCDVNVGLAFAGDCAALDAQGLIALATSAVVSASADPQRFCLLESAP